MVANIIPRCLADIIQRIIDDVEARGGTLPGWNFTWDYEHRLTIYEPREG